VVSLKEINSMGSIKFGTDGWRAEIGKDFNFYNLRALAQAVADYLKVKGKGIASVVVGHDARFLSRESAFEVTSVLSANNVKVLLSCEKVSTPVISFTTKNRKMDLGIMITASHNPASFNGFKIKNSQGGAADNTVTREIEKLLFKSKVKSLSLRSAQEKGLLHISDLSKDYVRFIRDYINVSLIKKSRLKVLIDLMYGSGDSYIERVLKDTQIKFSYLHSEFNPSFGGINPEPIERNLQEMIIRMRKQEFDLGIALDGDGDRIACVLRGGRYIDAQVILPVLTLHVAQNRKWSGAMVKTIEGSDLMDSVALRLGRILFETPVGFKYISGLFKKEDILIGGEEAGGIGVKNYIPERDATMAAVLLLEMACHLRKDPLKLVRDFERKFGRRHYRRISVPVGSLSRDSLNKLKIPPYLLGRRVQRVNRLDGVKIITDSSWLMLRASGTEPIVRIYAEAKTKKEVERIISQGKKFLDVL